MSSGGRVLLVTVAVSMLIAGLLTSSAAAALGSATNSNTKPAYCSQLANLHNSIHAVGVLGHNATPSKLKSGLERIRVDVIALITSAQSAFQSSESKSSISALNTAWGGYASTPTKEHLTAYEAALNSALTRVNDFSRATHSQCG